MVSEEAVAPNTKEDPEALLVKDVAGFIEKLGITDPVQVKMIRDKLLDMGRAKNSAEANAEQLGKLATKDALTEISNLRGFDEGAMALFETAQRTNQPLAFLELDLDSFKLVNDTLGHPEGDKLLQEVARLIKQNSRLMDVHGRIGGDEFLLAAELTTAQDSSNKENPKLDPVQKAILIATRLRRAIEHAALQKADPVRAAVRSSIGVAIYYPGINGADSINFNLAQQYQNLKGSADQALYAAKAAGKNRIVITHGGKMFQVTPGIEDKVIQKVEQAVPPPIDPIKAGLVK